MKKKRVAITIPQVPFVKGGAELHVKSLASNLISRGYEADILSIPYKWYPESSLYDNMLAWRFMDLNEANGKKIDLLISTKFPSYGVKHDNKVTWLIHQFRQAYDLYDSTNGLRMVENGSEIKRHVEKFDEVCLLESKKIYANSKNVANRLMQFNKISSEPLYHPPSLVGRYYSDTYGDYILSVGRLDQLKRNELLIESLRYCDKKVRAIIAGKGPEMDNLKKIANKFNLTNRVDFLGFVSDEELLNLYANSFAVFFAPIDEDYGYITLEAFLSEKPVITCYDSGGVLEFVEDGKCGFVCQNNSESLGEKINLLFNDKKKCNDFGAVGYKKVCGITWDNAIDKLTATLR